jgi:hypothetical protein
VAEYALAVFEDPDAARQFVRDEVVEQYGGTVPTGVVDTVTHRSQFWRESEQAWVDDVHVRTWGPDKDEPTRWRRQRRTTVTLVHDWEDGRG